MFQRMLQRPAMPDSAETIFDDVPALSGRRWRRKRFFFIILALFWLLLFALAVKLWTDPPVEYDGRWMSLTELRSESTQPRGRYCAQNAEKRWYAEMGAYFPLVPLFRCFDTEAEAWAHVGIVYPTPTQLSPHGNPKSAANVLPRLRADPRKAHEPTPPQGYVPLKLAAVGGYTVAGTRGRE